jgi:hypothetical protein
LPTYSERLDVAVYGADQLARLAARLKEAGDLALRRRMMAALRKSGEEIRDAEKAAALALPGEKYQTGLRERIAAATVVRTRASAGRAGVRVMVNRSALPASKERLPLLMNKGAWRHPVFGNRENWAAQTSERGWWNRTIGQHIDSAQRRMLEVLRETERQITGG